MLAGIVACCALIAAAASDIHRREIPDSASGLVALSGLTFAILGGSALTVSLVFAFLFVAGALLFFLGVLGGGDVKLIAAMGFWLTPATIAPFLLVMALAGGVIAIGMIVAGALRQRPSAGGAQTVPYGVAIAVSGLFILFGAQ
jgi:prepilin peptidase CpaA